MNIKPRTFTLLFVGAHIVLLTTQFPEYWFLFGVTGGIIAGYFNNVILKENF